jgi:hypothetical protein
MKFKELKDLLIEKKKYGHTLWIDSKGKIIDLGNKYTHGDFLVLNWEKYFPNDELSEKTFWETVYNNGWIQIRNFTHGFSVNDFAITGNKDVIRKRKNLLNDLVFDAYFRLREEGNEDYLFVGFYWNKNGKFIDRDVYKLPDDMEPLLKII